MTNRPHWGFIDIILVYVGILVLSILFGVLNNRLGPLLPQWWGSEELQNFVLGFLVQFLATVAFVYLFAVLRSRGKWSELGVKSARAGDFLRYGVGGGFFLVGLITALSYVVYLLQPELPPQYFEEMLRSVNNLDEFLVILVLGAVLAPLSEELFYRGMIYPVFRKWLGPLGGAIFAGVVFGLAHWDFWRSIPLAIGGAVLCYIYEKSGSILVSSVAHGVWNGLMSLVVYLSLK